MGWDVWWVWMSAGIVLGILEVLAPGFIFLGFAVGAGLVGLLLLIGVGAWLSSSASLLLLLFAILSIIAWLVLRKVMGVRQNQARIVETDINEH